MAKEKKPLTAAQTKNKYRAFQYLFTCGEVVSIIAPFITLGIVYGEQWFTSEEGWKIGLGGALALGLCGIAVWMFTAKKEKESKITNGWITLIVGWFAVAFIFVLLQSIMAQISSIMLWGGLGLLGAFGLDNFGAKRFKLKADMYKEVLGDVKKDTLKEKIAQEIEENKKNGKVKW